MMIKEASDIMIECQEAVNSQGMNSGELDELMDKKYVAIDEVIKELEIAYKWKPSHKLLVMLKELRDNIDGGGYDEA